VELFNNKFDKYLPPISPILFDHKCNFFIEELLDKAFEKCSIPKLPI
jgi:hypothetical protein